MISIRCVHGEEAFAHISDIARLRIEVFREFPYLYDGDDAYEQRYLASYFACPESIVVLALDGERVVGASTGIPLKAAEQEWRQAFRDTTYSIDSIFYFGESVLEPNYRGRGIGHLFFDERESFAQQQRGIRYTSFCSVVRDGDHPSRPAGYRSNETFWRKRGYEKIPNLTAYFQWKDLGVLDETSKKMEFWLRELPCSCGDKTT